MIRPSNRYLLLFFGLLGITYSFEVGQLYRYNYATSVLLNEVELSHARRAVGFRITADVLITPLWQSNSNPEEKLLKLDLEKGQLHVLSKDSFKPQASSFTSAPSSPIYILWNNGDITKVFVNKDDESNIKKGIASILQLKTESTEILQTDVSGECKIAYKKNGETIQKRRLSCLHPSRSQHYMHPNKVQAPSTVISSETDYELLNEKGVVKTAAGTEHIQIDSSLWSNAAMRVQSKHELALQSQEQTTDKLEGENIQDVIKQLTDTATELVEDTIVAAPQKIPCRENCKSLPTLVKDFKADLKNNQLGSFKSASAFLKLLQKFRSASKQELLKMMKNSKNKSILPQILDLIAAARTSAAWEAAVEYIDFTAKNIDLAERFLLGISTCLHPSDRLISYLLKLIETKVKDEKLKTSLIMTLGAVTRTFCKLDFSKCSSSPVVLEVADYLVNNLNRCGDTKCKLLYLRGLKTVALPSATPTLLKYITQGKPYAVVALSAIKNIGPEHFTDEVVTALKQIYYETVRKQDSTARIIAAELLLSSHRNIEIIPDLIHSLAKEESTEISTYVISKIFELSEKDEQHGSVIKNALKKQEVGNYHSLSQNGNSAVFTKPLSVGTGINVTYGMEMEMISGGLLKHSAVTVEILKEKDVLPLVSIGLFAEGLCSIAGEESCSGEGEEETTAGMELAVLGIGIRPYTFFHGTGELMGHVWAGTASDPISALQANFLFIDHSQVLALQNGFVVDMKIQGAFSLDLSASIDISIWNRNSHSIVKNSGAVVIEGKLEVDTAFAESWIAFDLGGESYIDFVTDFDFYNSPYRTCLQMSQPDLTVMYNINKTQAIPESRHKVQIRSKRKYLIPGRSYSFHKKNYNACKVLLSQ